ncbi:MAG: DUF2059 domain-containing protein [Flavobacteriaceae bacterium]|nr:DUF2059 domain-containing protein [Flavobacteriaceae bacterium]
MRLFFLTIFSVFCFTAQAQVDTFQQDIINYLNINGTHTQYADAYEKMFDVLLPQFESANVPESFVKELKKDKEESLDEIVKFLTFAYRKHFTQEDIQQMTSFYKSKAGQKMVHKTGTLTEAENAEIAAFFGSDLGKKIEEKRTALSEDIAEISGHWSRDLFSEKMSALVKNGYVPKQ